MPSFTVDTMLARVKRKCQLATTTNDGNAKLTDAEIVQIMDEEIQTRLFGALMQVRDDYFVEHRTVTINANQRFAQLPTYVASSTIADVGYIDTSVTPNKVYPLTRLYSGAALYQNSQQSNRPTAYVIEGDRIGLVRVPSEACVLLVRYERRPNRLHLASSGRSCAIASYDSNTLDFTLASPTALNATEMAAGTTVDIVRATPPLGVPIQGLDVYFVASPIWTLAQGVVDHSSPDQDPIVDSQINAGDYLSVSGETPVFPLPEVWWSPAIYAASAAVCREIGDAENGAANEQQAAQLIAQAIALQSNRVRKQNPVVFNHSSPRRIGPWGIRRPGENEWWFG